MTGPPARLISLLLPTQGPRLKIDEARLLHPHQLGFWETLFKQLDEQRAHRVKPGPPHVVCPNKMQNFDQLVTPCQSSRPCTQPKMRLGRSDAAWKRSQYELTEHTEVPTTPAKRQSSCEQQQPFLI